MNSVFQKILFYPISKYCVFAVFLLRDDAIHGLIDGCPMLDELTIRESRFSTLDTTLRIQHPFINKLCLDYCCQGIGPSVADHKLVMIDAPNLVAFAHNGVIASIYVFKNIKSFHSLSIGIVHYSHRPITHEENPRPNSDERRLTKLVIACSTTTRLSFSGESVKALYRSSVQLPTFQNLTWLTFDRMKGHGLKILAAFLESAPNLKILTFGEEPECSFPRAGFQSLLQSLPVCVELHLKKIEIREFTARRWD